ncbi:MAG: hypothetical protein JHC33_12555 [Ignisphaera sp.]|nr:hypothetical protein [Ignisphaera sp.]
MAKAETISKDFFSTATRMSLSRLQDFLQKVVLKMAPKDCPPIIIWGTPGIAKTAIIEKVFLAHEKGLITAICSQLGALDSNGLPHIESIPTANGSVSETRFTPTNIFGRGKHNVFLDELNNSSPSMMAALQNLLSAKRIGGDDFSDVYIIAACNPPSTNSLANDLNHPTISRCINIILDYTLDDFMNYAISGGDVHPAIVAFHKKTSGQYLQAKWDVLKNNTHGYQVPEPTQNEPYPCPRSWSLASEFLNTMSRNQGIEYSLLQPIVEGCVGVLAASQFATTYAYMNRLPDIEAVYKGTLVSKDVKIKGEVAIEYLTAFACISFASAMIDNAKHDGVKCIMPKTKEDKKTPAWHLIAGLHRMIQFVMQSCSPELAQMIVKAVTDRITALPESFSVALYGDPDPDNGLTRVKTFQKMASAVSTNANSIQASIG